MLENSANEDLSTSLYENPYASSPAMDLEDASVEINENAPWHSGRSVLTWTVVCSLSSAPSFFFAIGSVAKNQALAMVLGVIIFIGIYTIADMLSRNSPFRRNSRMRSILRSTFIVRSIMVVVFPIAIYTDVTLGMLSVAIVGSVAQSTGEIYKRAFGFIETLATTLVQGCLLSILLFFLGLLISVFVFVIRSLASSWRKVESL